ncbi:MAG: S8 family serine peptidase [Bacteroidetes bacterium]|nr:S8 family serine peptidase [Bacteroidota bacterium]
MKNYFIALLIFASVISITGQSKYLVYFKDKGIEEGERLNKTSELYKIAESQLSQRAIERRKKVLGEEYITLRDIPINLDYINNLSERNIEILQKLKWFNAVSCILTEEQLVEISGLGFVDKVEKVKVYKRRVVEDEPFSGRLDKIESTNTLDYGNSYNQMNLSQVPVVHDLGINGEDVIIGFIDSGFNWEYHESTKNLTVLWEYDYVYVDDNTGDNPGDVLLGINKHGTQTLAIACGYQPGQVIGPSFNADVMLARTEDEGSERNVEEDNFAAAVQAMESRGVDILTSSLGYNLFDAGQTSYTYNEMDGLTAICTIAYEAAAELGVLTITSAGNEGALNTNNLYSGLTAPADGELTVAVGSVTSGNSIVSSSSSGPTADGRIKPEVVAQGSNAYSVGQSAGSFSFVNGTSFAAPLVAGIAGQLYSAFPHLTNRQARQMLMESGDNVAQPDNRRGWGLVSAKKAVTYPNLQNTGNGFRLHKIFIEEGGINTSSVKVHYQVNGGSETESAMSFDGNYLYTFNFPALANDDDVNLYFTFERTTGGSSREPLTSFYSMNYGQLHINFATDIEAPEELPTEFTLGQNYPNPFNGWTHIEFSVLKKENVKLHIFNVLGQKVRTLFDGIMEPGNKVLSWNGTDDSGAGVVTGAYFYTLVTPGGMITNKMIYLK